MTLFNINKKRLESMEMTKYVLIIVMCGFYTIGACGSFKNVCNRTGCLCQLRALGTVLDCSAKHVRIQDVCATVKALKVAALKAGENNFGRITENDLKGCETLTELDLHYNQMVSMPKFLFRDFKKLRRLDLRANNLNIYKPNGTFHSSSLPETLHVLYLGGNVPENPWMHHLEYPDLSNLQELQELYMDGIEADFGPEYQIMNTTYISLSSKNRFSYCNMTQITDNMFSNLRSVRSLNMSSCKIRNVSAEAFRNLKHLTTLDMSYNIRLGYNPLGVFSYGLQFTNIKHLNYSYVYPTFGLGTSLQMSHICYLHNTSLTEIVLDGNRLALLQTNAFLLVPKSLERFQMNDNKPTFGPYLSQLGCLSNVRTILANGQSKYHSPMSYLIDVELSDGPTTDIPWHSVCPFMTEEYLKTLQTSNCHYVKRDDFSKIFSPTFPGKVETVSFKNCQMNYKLSVTINVKPENNSLKHADFSGNSLYDLENPVGPFPNLKEVRLSKNYCESIGPRFFDYIESIEYLNISDNYLGPFFTEEASKDVFLKLQSLNELCLGDNKITNLFPETFAPLKNLSRLFLNNNKIKSFDLDLQPFVRLSYLDLQYNFLSSLPSHVMDSLSRNMKRNVSMQLDLRGNPLKYDCDNIHFIKWLFSNRKNIASYSNLTFTQNVTVDLAAVQRLESRCRSYTIPIVVGSIAVTVFISVVVVGVVYRNRWKIRYFLYMSKEGFLGYKKLSNDSEAEEFQFDAFISYAEENLRFIMNGIIPKLENEGLKLCVHERDFVAGKPISDNIIDAIKNSRKTVIVLSDIFLKKKWCMYEFNMARMESIYSRGDNNHVIVVMFEHVPTNRMPLEMLDWIRTNSYIEYTREVEGEALFWNNFTHAVST